MIAEYLEAGVLVILAAIGVSMATALVAAAPLEHFTRWDPKLADRYGLTPIGIVVYVSAVLWWSVIAVVFLLVVGAVAVESGLV